MALARTAISQSRELVKRDEVLARIHPLLRGRLLIGENMVSCGLRELAVAADILDWTKYCDILHWLFVINPPSTDQIHDRLEWLISIARAESQISEDYLFANALLIGFWQQGDWSNLDLATARLLDERLISQQPYGTKHAWRTINVEQHSRYIQKHGQKLTSVYTKMKSMFGDDINQTNTHLDLGCGSGLLGRVFKDQRRKSIGVDHSTTFLSHVSNVYDEIFCESLLTFLEKTDQKFDLVTCGGVVQYFFYPRQVFEMVRHVMNDGGLLGFNTIRNESADGPMRPSSTQALAHSQFHILEALSKAGFEVIATHTQHYWEEHASDIFVCRR